MKYVVISTSFALLLAIVVFILLSLVPYFHVDAKVIFCHCSLKIDAFCLRNCSACMGEVLFFPRQLRNSLSRLQSLLDRHVYLVVLVKIFAAHIAEIDKLVLRS